MIPWVERKIGEGGEAVGGGLKNGRGCEIDER